MDHRPHVPSTGPHRTQDGAAALDGRDGVGIRPGTREAVICSGWGPDADWVRNLPAGPAVQVQLGRESYTPQHRFLSEDESFEVAVQFRREHPWRLRLISTILGWGDLRDDTAARKFTRTHPFVALQPAAVPPT